jgi:hypothetical protein
MVILYRFAPRRNFISIVSSASHARFRTVLRTYGQARVMFFSPLLFPWFQLDPPPSAPLDEDLPSPDGTFRSTTQQ